LSDDIKKPEQRGREREAHELLEAFHPRARLGEELHPAGLRGEQEVRKGHAGRNGGEHGKNDE
jgi:hypothetical protein